MSRFDFLPRVKSKSSIRATHAVAQSSEKSLSVWMLMTLWATRLVSRKPPSISRVTKIFVILAHEDLDGLLLRIDIEINNGPLANVLNTARFHVKKEIRHMTGSSFS